MTLQIYIKLFKKNIFNIFFKIKFYKSYKDINYFFYFCKDTCKIKFIKKLYKILLIALLVILLLPIIAYIALQSNTVQNYLTQKIATHLSERLDTKITLEHINIALFNSLAVKNLYIEDQKHDTLLFINKLKININSIDLSQHKIFVNKIVAKGTYINLFSDSLNVLNLQFLLDAFDTNKVPWEIRCKNFKILNTKFSFKAYNPAVKDHIINFKDILATNINLHFKNIEIQGDTINFGIKNLSFQEKSGFVVHKFSSQNNINSHIIALNNINIQTPHTNLIAKHFTLGFKEYSDFSDFVNKVKINTQLRATTIGLKDISYFAHKLYGLEQNITISGNIKGKINSLKGKKIRIQFGEQTQLSGSFNLMGLPDIKETFIYIDIKNLSTTGHDIELITIPPFSENKHISLPEKLSMFGTMNYKGNFTGFINDFVAYGDFSTDLGNISTDISFKQDTIKKQVKYSGKLKANDFNLGKLTGNEKYLGKLTLNAQVQGFGSLYNKDLIGIQALMNGVINSIELNNYNYQNLKIEGELSDKKFDGAIYVDDPNMKMEFLGRVDFSEQVPVFDFTADISDAMLYNLNLEKSDTLSSMSFLLKANFVGSNIDNINGTINLFNSSYKTGQGEIILKDLSLSADENNQIKTLALKSDLVDADISGNYEFVSLIHSLKNFIYYYLPALSQREWELGNRDREVLPFGEDLGGAAMDFKFNVHLKNTKQLSQIFFPSIYISPNTMVSGNYNSLTNELSLKANSPELIINQNKFNEFYIVASTKNSILSINSTSKSFSINNFFSLDNFTVNTQAKNDSIEMNICWDNQDPVEYPSADEFHRAGTTINKGDISALTVFTRQYEQKLPSINITLLPSEIIIADSLWTINKSKIQIDHLEYPSTDGFHMASTIFIKIDNLTINNKEQQICLNGKISKNESDTLSVLFNNVNLANINILTKGKGLEINGILNGEAHLSDFYSNTLFSSDINIENFIINSEEFGKSFITSSWDKQSKNVHLQAFTKRGKLKTLIIHGDYLANSNTLDFNIKLNKLRLNILEPFLKKNFSNIRGIASGDLRLTGTLKKPLINGRIKLQKTAFTINYLQTRYNLTNYIDIESNSVVFNNIDIFDLYGNIAIANGLITHNNFKDVNFDISLDTKNFLVLNTTEHDNSIYYGKAFATGVININGTPGNLKIDISARTEKNTQFFIPLSSGEEASENNFVTFISTYSDTMNQEEHYEVDLSGIQLNFDLEVTPEAEVQIIFDEKVGDIIKGRGYANLNMEINTSGNFNMYGEYIIESGDYLFTLQNIINKKFDVEKGGSINWNGDPFNAVIDLNAVYRLKASLYNLMQSIDTSEIYRKRIPVECQLKMSAQLMNPNIKFDVNLPTADNNAKDMLYSLSEEDKNKQFLSLLVINNFYTRKNPLDESKTSTYGVGVTSSELLSNQLSHWLSQISNDFDIGFNYRPGDEITSNEVELALSTQLFNDRISINMHGNIGGVTEQQSASQQQTTSNIVGDFNIDYKINKSGKVRVKAFNNANENLIYYSSPYTQGIGLFYREDFDSVDELFKKYWKKILAGKKKDKGKNE